MHRNEIILKNNMYRETERAKVKMEVRGSQLYVEITKIY